MTSVGLQLRGLRAGPSAASWASVVLSLAGCGRAPQTAEVTGRVTFDGKPQAQVHLEFVPLNKADGQPQPPAYAITDGEGRFRAYRLGNGLFGVVVGPNAVRITAMTDSAAKVDRRYGKGELVLDVKAGPNVYDLDLPMKPSADWKPGLIKPE